MCDEFKTLIDRISNEFASRDKRGTAMTEKQFSHTLIEIKKAHIFYLPKIMMGSKSQFKAHGDEFAWCSDMFNVDHLGLPFSTCFFAPSNDNVLFNTVMYTRDDKTNAIEEMSAVGTYSFLTMELAPGRVWICAYYGGYRCDENGKQISPAYHDLKTFEFRSDKKAYSSLEKGIIQMIQEIISQINSKENLIANETCRVKIRVGTGKNKEFIKIKNIVRIIPKKERDTARPIIGKNLDFTHRFEVRGHWRKVDGIGKDRQGNYNVKGFTWVVPFVKGPEEKPLVKKTRLLTA